MADLFPGMGTLLGFGALTFVFGIALYVYFALALMTVAKKMNIKNPWLAWIPIANLYLMTQMAGLSGLWTLAVLLYFVPFIGGLAFLIILAWWWWQIAEKLNKPGWWGILMVLPVINLIIIGILAWGE